MGQMLGVLPLEIGNQSFIEPGVFDLVFENPLVFRKNTPLAAGDWAAIQAYYLQNAPKKMEAPKPAVEQNLPQFEVHFPGYFLSPPSTTMVKILDGQLFVGDANSERLYHFDTDLNLKRKASVGQGAVSFNRLPDGDVVTVMGAFSPTDVASGQIFFLPNQPGQLRSEEHTSELQSH